MEERLPHARVGREKEFAQCVLPEAEMLLRVATTPTARADHAEDLARDTLLQAYRRFDRYDGQRPRNWLLTLMHQARADRRHERGSLPAVGRDGGPGPSPTLVSAHPVESVAVGGTFHEVVDTALAAPPDTYRQVVRLVDVDGLSYAEAAGLLGLSEAIVSRRLRRARRRIRVRLAAAGLVPGRGER
ncbi:sigma-70 family RNA polymerase sigma factor [Streptomyces sp. NPDC001435]|uniref:sigma-70 family RNA polymerase sigma factor n=1 Tax=unclassified Streptomyces TaxID=2593676 RepID=UPI0036A96038